MKNQGKKTARFAAIEILARVRHTRLPVKSIFEEVFTRFGIPDKERGLTMTIVYGCLRQLHYLETLVQKLSNKPLKKLDPLVYAALLTGLFQLFCLDRIPDSAAVNETVNGAKTAGVKKHLHGFINGVLRASIRQRSHLCHLINEEQARNKILNHPGWLTERWEKNFGRPEMERICGVNNTEPQLVIRINTGKTDREAMTRYLLEQNIDVRPGQFAPESLVIHGYHGSITTLPGYHEGYFQVQDEAAQLVSMLLQPFRQHGRYLDCCAGLGGKTTHIMELTSDYAAEIVATEPEKGRHELLQQNVKRLAPSANLTIVGSTVQEYCQTDPPHFDGILADAPCSGTGVIGRHPDIRWNRQPGDILRYQADQLDILEQSSRLLVAGGVLVYATCSLEPEENSEVIREFLARRPDFALTDAGSWLPQSCSMFMKEKFFSPHPDRTIDGFFGARLVKTV